ncbi:AAA domain-containing protein [Oribacterium sp. KHPX15]|uniref:ATP-binding protein n=1 Tax=unclassified Oribacterium TaxID=2629782 RepID=UPI0004E11342|nr:MULTISPECIES: AAA family ATPase [unclassified Oribacterium]SEA35102.1 AAA domain-containing protein [Oribacterium sp. KHPX15]
MRFVDIHIDGFGKFHNFDMHLEDGMNIIYGHNEAGKSTLHSFLQAMLYGLGRRSGKPLSKKYQSWDYPEDYSGQLRIEYEGKKYLISRDFNQDLLSIYNETDGEDIEYPELWLNTMLKGISETAFENTVSIGQLRSATSRGMINELKSCIRNLNATGDISLDSEGALSILDEQRTRLESKLVPDAAKTYAQLIGEVRNIERDIQQPEYENQLRKYQNLRTEARTDQVDLQTKKEVLIQKVAGQEAVLQQAGLKNEDEIQYTLNRGIRLYNTYVAEQERDEDPKKYIIPGVCFAVAVISLILDILFACAGSDNVAALFRLTPEKIPAFKAFVDNALLGATVPVAIFTFLFVLTLILGIVFVNNNRNGKKNLNNSNLELARILSKFLGSPEISDRAMDSFEKHMDELLKVSGELNENRASLEALTQEIQGLNDNERKYDVELQRQNEKQTELEGKLQHLVNVKNRVEMLKHTISENDAITEEIDAVNLAYETMTELEGSIRSSFGHHLNKEAGDLISGITGGVYDSMWIDQNLDIFMNTPTKLVPIEDVSSGTMDQIYLALRLAASRLMQKKDVDEDFPVLPVSQTDSEKSRLPLIFDDSFAMYDEKRLNSALHFIMDIHKGQILLFTCHTRERRMLKEAKDKFNVIEL